MRKLKNPKRWLLLLLLPLLAFVGCFLFPHNKDPLEVCVRQPDEGKPTCMVVDSFQVVELHRMGDKVSLAGMDARKSVDSLGGDFPAHALFLLRSKGKETFSYRPEETTVYFENGELVFRNIKDGVATRTFQLEAQQSLLFAQSPLGGTIDVVRIDEIPCERLSLLESLMKSDSIDQGIFLEPCGDTVYARIGHVIVAISELRMIGPLPGNRPPCDKDKDHKLIRTYDLPTTLTALNTSPVVESSGEASGNTLSDDCPTFVLDGFAIWLCGDVIQFTGADADGREVTFSLDLSAHTYFLSSAVTGDSIKICYQIVEDLPS